ncbi:MAG: exo-alpha-sialidase [Saprospirales bacterium]|nr:exo-alpha-sialidase [Saprospirales bacterium]
MPLLVHRFLLLACLFQALPLPAQISTITQYMPAGVDTLGPLRAETPQVVACANGYCYAFSRGNAAFYRPDQPDSRWQPLGGFDDPEEAVYGLADAGAAVLVQTLATHYDPFSWYVYTYRIYRTTASPDSLELTLEFHLNGYDGLDSDRFGYFNVVHTDLVYFTLGKSVGIDNQYWNYYSTDNGVSWTALGLQPRNLFLARQAGNLYVLPDQPDYFNESDSLYWSNKPDFSSYNPTYMPGSKFGQVDIRWLHDTLFYFTNRDSFSFSAFGGLFWETRAWPAQAEINAIAVHNDRLYLATNNGLFESASPSGKWTPLYQFQDCYYPEAYQLYPVDEGLPWVSGAATALLRPADPAGAGWRSFDEGLPGNGTRYLKVLRDTLYGSYGVATYRSADGLHWEPLNAPGLRGVNYLNCTGIVEHQGQLFAPAGYGYAPVSYQNNGIFIQPAGQDWHFLDTFPNTGGYNLYLSASGQYLYWYNSLQVQRSDDLGATWAPLDVPVANSISAFIASGDTLFLLEYSPHLLWMSTDRGMTWIPKPLPVSSGYFALFLQKGRLVLGGEKLATWASDDWGNTWKRTNLGISTNYSVSYQTLDDDILVAHLSPNHYALTFYRGVMLSLDAGAHWLKLLLPVDQGSYVFYGLARYGEYLYYSGYNAGNYRFPFRPVLQKLEEITPKVPAREPRLENRITISPNPAVSGETWLTADPAIRLPQRWQLYDAQGRLVQEGEMDMPRYRLGLGQAPEGVYALYFPGLGGALKVTVGW